MAQIILYQDSNYRGYHVHIFGNMRTLDTVGFNDRASSAIVVDGKWRCFADRDYNGRHSDLLGPGFYPTPEAINLPNDWMSSVRLEEG